MDLKTSLYDCHVAGKGKIVPFAGYLLPVQYDSGVIAEHMAVRTACGLFDVSHMGEMMYTGADALANINYIVTNDCSGMSDDRARYSPMCNDQGGVVDDLIIYKMNKERYMVVVNAANRHKDFKWMQEHLFGECKLQDISDSIAQLALQGPRAEEILRKIADPAFIPEGYYTFVEKGVVGGMPSIISRTGYTGEDGFEMYCAAQDAAALWKLLLETGKSEGLIPCGLGARDTLRLEAGMPLYGHEMNDAITPYEANLGLFVKLKKENFIGKEVLEQKKTPQRQRVGLKMTGRGIAREQCPVFVGDRQIGVVTSGTYCPYVKSAIAMALVEISYKEPATAVEVDIRGRRVTAKVVPIPFYKRKI